MEKAKIKEIGNYLKELEEGLVDSVYNPASLQLKLPKLYQTIELLMDETFKKRGQTTWGQGGIVLSLRLIHKREQVR